MTTNIHYVCMSDMHFGDDGSLLTNLDPATGARELSHPSPVVVRLVDCLRALVEANTDGVRPTLVLDGDILEMALTTEDNALTAFERFLELVFPREGARLFSQIIYIPGNHDHHLWEQAREKQYADHVLALGPKDKLDEPWHTTAITIDDGHPPVVPLILRAILDHRVGAGDVPISVAYPNHGIFSKDGKKGVIFSHGHFIESLYSLVSKLKTSFFPGSKIPDNIYDLEKENFAWIDFFWSTMGRQGEAGKGVELIYKSLQDENRLSELVTNLVSSLVANLDIPATLKPLEAPVLRHMIKALLHVAMQRERQISGNDDDTKPLSQDGEDGLGVYVANSVRNQLVAEGHPIPDELALVIGHTHKPFEEERPFVGYPRDVDVYNTGGWIVETKDPSVVHGGAIVLVDENLDVASVRMFHDMNNDSPQIAVSWPRQETRAANAFQGRLAALVDAKAEPWASFSKAAAAAIDERRRNLIKMNETEETVS